MLVHSEIALHSFAGSPYALKVRCYLLYKQLSYKTVYVDPVGFQNKLPVGNTIPVLTHGNESRNESTNIGIWLDELYPDNWVSNRLILAVFRAIVESYFRCQLPEHGFININGKQTRL